MKKYNVAILGATGAVGTEFLKLIEERDFPLRNYGYWPRPAAREPSLR